MSPVSITKSGTSSLKVFEVDHHTDTRWATFAERHPEALIYHHPLWSEILERAYGYRATALACEDETGELQGVLPLFFRRGLLTGKVLASLPHTPVAGPLTSSDDARQVLVRAAIERVREQPGTSLQIKAPSLWGGNPIEGMVGRPGPPSYVFHLPTYPQEVRFGRSRSHTAIKASVRRSAKLGLQIRTATTEAELRAWYPLYLETVRWHAAPPRSYRFFKAVWEILKPRDMVKLLLAVLPGEGKTRLVAGSLILTFGQTHIYFKNGRRKSDLWLWPNDPIHWRAIHDAWEAGARYYDFGEVGEGNEGLTQYKSKWGADTKLLYRYYYPAVREAETGTLGQDRPVRRLANATWRRLPLSVTALLGDPIYRYL